MQIPVGVLLDRFGPRSLLMAGMALMSVGQLVFAYVHSYPLAVAARVLIGVGDSTIFISVLFLISAWFPVRRGALLAQLTAQIGQLGSIIASAPLVLALQSLGWTRTFAGASAVGLAFLIVLAVGIKDGPEGARPAAGPTLRQLLASLPVLWRQPGTRLVVWTSFTALFPLMVLTLLWGYPFLVIGQGASEARAAFLIALSTPGALVSSLVMTHLTARWPYWRSIMVVGTVTATAMVWAVVLGWPGRAPFWLLVVLVLVVSLNSPATMVGFDVARTVGPRSTLGRVNGLVNAGGFVGSLLALMLIGLFLDWREPAGPSAYDLRELKQAMSLQYLVWLLGLAQLLRYRRKTIRLLDSQHPGSVARLRAGETFVFPENV